MTNAEIIELAARYLAALRSGDTTARRAMRMHIDDAERFALAIAMLEDKPGTFVIDKEDPDNTLALAHAIAADFGARVAKVKEDSGKIVLEFNHPRRQ